MPVSIFHQVRTLHDALKEEAAGGSGGGSPDREFKLKPVSIEAAALRCSVSPQAYRVAMEGPHQTVGRAVAGRILAIFNKVVPSGWPEEISNLRATYLRMEEALSEGDFRIYRKSLAWFIANHEEFSGDSIVSVGLWWVYAWVAFDDGEFDKARARYNEAGKHLAKLCKTDPAYELLLAQLKIASYATRLDRLSYDERREDTERPRMLPVIQAALICAQMDKYNWRAIRGGLDLASLSKLHAECELLFAALVIAHDGFADLNYTPAGVKSLADDPDFEWFIENVYPKLNLSK